MPAVPTAFPSRRVLATTRLPLRALAQPRPPGAPGSRAGTRKGERRGAPTPRPEHAAAPASSHRPVPALSSSFCRRSPSRSGHIGFEARVIPVALEGRRELLEDVRNFTTAERRTFHSIPSTSADSRKVRGADEGRRETALPVEEPGLRMEMRALRLVRDLDVARRARPGCPARAALVEPV